MRMRMRMTEGTAVRIAQALERQNELCEVVIGYWQRLVLKDEDVARLKQQERARDAGLS